MMTRGRLNDWMGGIGWFDEVIWFQLWVMEIWRHGDDGNGDGDGDAVGDER